MSEKTFDEGIQIPDTVDTVKIDDTITELPAIDEHTRFVLIEAHFDPKDRSENIALYNLDGVGAPLRSSEVAGLLATAVRSHDARENGYPGFTARSLQEQDVARLLDRIKNLREDALDKGADDDTEATPQG